MVGIVFLSLGRLGMREFKEPQDWPIRHNTHAHTHTHTHTYTRTHFRTSTDTDMELGWVTKKRNNVKKILRLCLFY